MKQIVNAMTKKGFNSATGIQTLMLGKIVNSFLGNTFHLLEYCFWLMSESCLWLHALVHSRPTDTLPVGYLKYIQVLVLLLWPTTDKCSIFN